MRGRGCRGCRGCRGPSRGRGARWKPDAGHEAGNCGRHRWNGYAASLIPFGGDFSANAAEKSPFQRIMDSRTAGPDHPGSQSRYDMDISAAIRYALSNESALKESVGSPPYSYRGRRGHGWMISSVASLPGVCGAFAVSRRERTWAAWGAPSASKIASACCHDSRAGLSWPASSWILPRV